MKYKILIVEDDAAIRETLIDLLEISGYMVFAAENGLKGLELIDQQHFDIIISDVIMPEMDGFELLKKIRNNAETELIPTIMLTAKVELESKLKGLEMGADDYITKPFDAEELLRVVKLRIEKRNKLQQNVLKSERERMSDKLHNGIQSYIVAANMGLKSISKNATTLSPEEREIIQKSTSILDTTLEETRNLSHHLVSNIIEKKSFKKCITDIIDLLSVSEKIHFNYDFPFEQLKNKQVELTIYSIVQEMITNSVKHSQTNKFSLSITGDDGEITVFYSDNGIGFDTTTVVESEGLKGIRKKIEKLNGKLNINAAVGQGVTIKFTVKNYA